MIVNKNFLIDERAKEVADLKKRMEKLKIKLESIIEKNYVFLKLVQRTDGSLDNLPESIIFREQKIEEADVWLYKTIPTMYVGNENIDLRMIGNSLETYEDLYNKYFKKYDDALNDLTSLYSKKNKIVGDKNITMEEDNDNTNYKLEAIKILSIFTLYGVDDPSYVKFDIGKKINLEKKANVCLKKLTEAISEISPTEVYATDIVKIKSALNTLSRMNHFDNASKNISYDYIEDYIRELNSRKTQKVL